jgi:hypothetical protein
MFNDPFRVFGWCAIIFILIVFGIAVAQHFSFGCINLGFFKSCGVSVLK